MTDFKAILIEKDSDDYRAAVKSLSKDMLPDADVLVRVDYSTINYKDALALTGDAPVVRNFPMIPGIDFAGVVEHSSHPKWKAGDKVVLNGFGCGEVHFGGLAEYARVSGDWLVALPEGLTTAEAMAIGTAGYTSMLSLMALQAHDVTPDKGDVLVTGANGGVGSVAIALLAANGYRVVASTGRVAESDYLKELGAAEIIDRAELSEPGKPLLPERWAGVIDCVGSHTLANACAATKANGTVAACGLAQGRDFPSTVTPFILRGVTLTGINSVYMPIAKREEAWRRLGAELDKNKLATMTAPMIGLEEALNVAPDLLAGKVRGRLVVDPRL